jgi:hypothetical protein
MSAIPYGQDRDEHLDDEQDDTFALPTRRRRQFLNRRSAALLALVTCAAGFYAGIRVEKGQLSTSSSTTRGFTPPALGGSSTRSSTSTSGSRSSTTSGFPGGAGGFPGAAPGGGNASIGTVSSVNGNTIYLTDTSGNTVKVALSSATKITKSLGVSKRSVHPGDSVVIRGLKNKSGALSATSISDSGASSSSSGGAGSSASGSGAAGGGTSAVNSLFGSGNGR